MALRIEKAATVGFCFGVKRAINTLEKIARERSHVVSLGEVVHNQQVLQRLARLGVSMANSLDDLKGNTVVISTHGVSPEVEGKIRAHHTEVINTTCPFVHRAQLAAGRLAKAGFSVIVYGDVNHPEVKGILGWANGKGVATLDENFITTLKPLPRRLGALSQTTQIPARFAQFVQKVIAAALTQDSELRIIDTICHDIRDRQAAALELARKVDLMFVVGSPTSANTNHLAQLCASVTKTYLVATAGEIQPSWLQGHHDIGVTSGASTAAETIDEVVARLEGMATVSPPSPQAG